MSHFVKWGFLILLLAFCHGNSTTLGQMPGYSGGYGAAPAGTAPQLPLYATRQSEFAIPFTVDPRVAQPVEVHLYVSVDQGENWRLQSRQPPTARQFTFRASGDGEYWFASRTINGVQRAETQESPRPELRVVVDTAAPQIQLTARPGENGAVLSSWQLLDQNLLASSLKIEYQEGVNEPWKPVAVERANDDAVRTSHQGQLTWWPETRSPTINIRAEVRDRAGNLAVANRRLLLPALVAQRNTVDWGTQRRTPDPFARHGQPSEGAVPWPSDNQPRDNQPSDGPHGLGSGDTAAVARTASPFGSSPTSLPRPVPHRSATTSEAGEFQLPEGQVPAHPASTQFPGQPSQPPENMRDSTTGGSGRPPEGDLRERPAHVVGPTTTPVSSARNLAGRLPQGERPQMTKSPRFHLAYDVDAVGPSGVAEVQLWATADAGHTWRLWGTDDDLESPFDVAAEEEGIFGFHVVIVGKNGMSGRRPRTGDLADIWVGVDTTPPTAKLTAATYGQGTDTGKLLIQWRAEDRFLDPRPVTLSFAETPQGPWTVIVSALPNSGQFAWPADPQLPSTVYLKLDVRDEAGNVVSDQTDQPVEIDGLAPKARIRGVQPLQDLDREAFRVPRRG